MIFALVEINARRESEINQQEEGKKVTAPRSLAGGRNAAEQHGENAFESHGMLRVKSFARGSHQLCVNRCFGCNSL